MARRKGHGIFYTRSWPYGTKKFGNERSRKGSRGRSTSKRCRMRRICGRRGKNEKRKSFGKERAENKKLTLKATERAGRGNETKGFAAVCIWEIPMDGHVWHCSVSDSFPIHPIPLFVIWHYSLPLS